MRRVLIYFSLLLISYVLLIQLWAPAIPVSENQETNNIIRAEHLIYNEQPDAIMVGSSLIGEFYRYSNAESIYFLPQAGGSAIEGLDLLRLKEIAPQVILIETNALYVSRRPEFASKLNEGVAASLAESLLAFRTQYRPTNIFLSIFHRLKHSGGESAPHKKVNKMALDLRLQNLGEMYAEPKDWSDYDESLKHVLDHILYFKGQGCRVVIVEFPIHPELIETRFHSERREKLFKQFEAVDITIIDLNNYDRAEFTDGIHFSGETQERLVNEFEMIASTKQESGI